MARVSINVNGYSYDIACGDGQEQHILDLGQDLERRVAELVGATGQAGEARLLAMAGLLLADELAEARAEIQTLRAAAQRAEDAALSPPSPEGSPSLDEDALAHVLETMAERIETIAQKVQRT